MMRNKLFLTIILIMLLAMSAAARTVKYVELGVNRSSFRNESCTPGYGVSGGVGINYYENTKAEGFFMGIGIVYQNKRLKIKDRTVASSIPPESSSFILTTDFDINLSIIEIPLKFGNTFIFHKNFSLNIYSGVGLSFPIKEHSTSKTKGYEAFSTSGIENYDFDYVRLDETEVTSSSFILIGTSISFHNLSFELSYAFANTATKNIFGISLEDQIDSLKLTIAFLF